MNKRALAALNSTARRGPRSPSGFVVCLAFLEKIPEKEKRASDGSLRSIKVQVARQNYYSVGKCRDMNCGNRCQ